jgi:hypothetical protein
LAKHGGGGDSSEDHGRGDRRKSREEIIVSNGRVEDPIARQIPNLPHILQDMWNLNKDGNLRGAPFEFMATQSPEGKTQLAHAGLDQWVPEKISNEDGPRREWP